MNNFKGGLNKDQIILIAAFLLITAGYSSTILPEEKIQKLTNEDGLYENIGAGFFLMTSVVFFMGFLKSVSGSHFLFHRAKKNYSLLILAAMFLVIFGEEISWGQRIFGYRSGNFFISNNMQLETNIHNLKIFHALDERHSKKEWWQYLSLNRLFRLFWIIWCVVIPVLEKVKPRVQDIRQQAGIPAVPVMFGFLFLINYSILKILENNLSSMTEVVEIEECITAVLFFLLACRLVWLERNNDLIDAAKAHPANLSENSYK